MIISLHMEVSNQIQRILSAFFLTDAQIVRVQYFNLNYKNKDVAVQEEVALLNNHLSSTIVESNIVVVIDNQAKRQGLKEIKKIINKTNIDHLSGLAIFCDSVEKKSIIRLINELKRFKISVFGVNPDYYFSLVPVDSKNRKNIEKYIFSLTSDSSWIGKTKKAIKRFLISCGLSEGLYEYFVIIAVPEMKCLSSNI